MKHPVDVNVGKRVRHRRWMLGMTQQQLADKVGIRFQQVQKYESGMNRISASRLWSIAIALDVSVAFFFEGLEGEATASSDTVVDEMRECMAQREAIELMRSYSAIPAEQRRSLCELARVLSQVA